MKKKILRSIKIVFPLLVVAISPSFLSSCSLASTTCMKVLNVDNWNDGDVSYSTLNSSKVSLKSAIYGSNYNKGNYIVFWGSLANSTVTNFLYGNASLSIPYEDNNFSTSNFFTNIFESSILENGTTLGYTVSFLMYLDTPTYNGDANTDSNALSGYDSPTDQYTISEVLNIYNDGNGSEGKYTEATLPLEAQLMVGNYKRNDQSAITYRELIKYVEQLRPNLSTTASDGGIIAFKKGKNPQSFSISDSIVSDLVTYYTPTADD